MESRLPGSPVADPTSLASALVVGEIVSGSGASLGTSGNVPVEPVHESSRPRRIFPA